MKISNLSLSSDGAIMKFVVTRIGRFSEESADAESLASHNNKVKMLRNSTLQPLVRRLTVDVTSSKPQSSAKIVDTILDILCLPS